MHEGRIHPIMYEGRIHPIMHEGSSSLGPSCRSHPAYKKVLFYSTKFKVKFFKFCVLYLTAADFFKGDLNVIPAKTTANLQKGLF